MKNSTKTKQKETIKWILSYSSFNFVTGTSKIRRLSNDQNFKTRKKHKTLLNEEESKKYHF